MTDIVKVDSKVIDEFLFSTGTKLTEQQKSLFKQLAILHNLNPFKREIYAIPYGQEMKIVTGYEVYLKRAEETKDLNGWEFRIEPEDDDLKGILTIYRKSWEKPFIHEVYMSEYNSGKSLWATKPKTMLKKVAVAQGFRLAFPVEFDGMLYTSDELTDSVGHVTEVKEYTTISGKQAGLVYALIKSVGLIERRPAILQQFFQVDDEHDITPELFRDFIKKIEEKIGRELGKEKLNEDELILVTDLLLNGVGNDL